MAQYKVLAKSFINNSIVEEGAIVDYDGKPGSNLELIEADKPGKAGKKGSKQDSAPVDEADQADQSAA
jgi:hypothetical protein